MEDLESSRAFFEELAEGKSKKYADSLGGIAVLDVIGNSPQTNGDTDGDEKEVHPFSD